MYENRSNWPWSQVKPNIEIWPESLGVMLGSWVVIFAMEPGYTVVAKRSVYWPRNLGTSPPYCCYIFTWREVFLIITIIKREWFDQVSCWSHFAYNNSLISPNFFYLFFLMPNNLLQKNKASEWLHTRGTKYRERFVTQNNDWLLFCHFVLS